MIDSEIKENHKRWYREETYRNNIGIENIERLIKFVNPRPEMEAVKVHLTKDVKFGNYTSNALRLFKPNDIYEDKKMFIENLEMFVPAVIKEENGMMNFYLKPWVFHYTIDKIIG